MFIVKFFREDATPYWVGRYLRRLADMLMDKATPSDRVIPIKEIGGAEIIGVAYDDNLDNK